MINSQSNATSETKTFSLIPNEKLLAIYSTMLKCRLLEQRATALLQHGKISSDLHASAGLESAAVAAVIDLEQADTLCLAPHDWLPAFVKGISLDTLFRTLAPTSVNSDRTMQAETERKNVLISSTKASPQKMLLDRASEASAAKGGAVAVAFVPDAASSLTHWQKTIQTAGNKRLPIIFVRYSSATGTGRPKAAPKPEALVHGVPSIAVDARDPVAVYRVAYEAIVRARQLRGASLLECIIHHLASSANNREASGARLATPHPILAMESYLKSRNITPQAEALAGFDRDLDLATRFLDK